MLGRIVSLLRPALAASPMTAPSRMPGLTAGGASLPQEIDHRPSGGEEVGHVDADRSRGRHSEGRKHGIASADRRIAGEDMGEPVRPCDLLQLRARIGDRDEMLSNFVRADRLCHQIEEVGPQQLRLQGRTGFARDDEQGARRVDGRGDGGDLAWIAAVEHMQHGMPGRTPKHSRDHFGAEARAAHAEQHDVVIFLRLGGEVAERLQVHGGAAARRQPAEPSILAAVRPQCRVAGPQPPRPALGASAFKPVLDKGLQRLGQPGFEPVHPVAEHARARPGDGAEQSVGGVLEFLDALGDQRGCHTRKIEAQPFRFGQNPALALDVRRQGWAGHAVIEKGVDGLGRHGVDRVSSDQRLDIKDVAVGRVLGPGRCPE